MSSGTGKLVCALLSRYSYSIVGVDDVICFIVLGFGIK